MSAVKGVEILGAMKPAYKKILTPEALKFVATLVRKHGPTREKLLAYRQERQALVDAKKLKLGFLKETKKVRDGKWKIAGIPADLQDRRVEITGPVDRKMVINALNSGAKCFMADFEDSAAPTWELMMDGHINLMDAVRRKISFTSPEGKEYKLNPQIATLIVRPRGWHLLEKHILIDGKPAPGGIVDFALFFFHNAKEQLKRGTGPYFYLPKMQSHREARLWNAIFKDAQTLLKIPQKTIKATVLIETIWAAFEMDEILYELRDHIVALNCGRWDYIFSFIKTYRNHADRMIPDRHSVGMDRHFLDSYSKLLCETCHKRGAQAMGGMAAFIPIKNDPAKNEQVFAKVSADKLR
ncbi:MAG: malate synthase, partial [Gammaproteobacteria bacterium]